MEQIHELENLQTLIKEEDALLLYFSNDMCSVCRVLKPKVSDLIRDEFPKVAMRYVDIDKSPMLAGQHRVFTIPTILVFIQGREQARLSRNIALHQVEDVLARPYSIIFD